MAPRTSAPTRRRRMVDLRLGMLRGVPATVTCIHAQPSTFGVRARRPTASRRYYREASVPIAGWGLWPWAAHAGATRSAPAEREYATSVQHRNHQSANLEFERGRRQPIDDGVPKAAAAVEGERPWGAA